MAKQPYGQIEVDRDDLKRFQRAVRLAGDKELDKRLKQVNKDVGQLIIDRLSPPPNPAAIGSGAGAAVRPSASKREVLLRVGGKHRERESLPMPTQSKARYALAQWGRKSGGFIGRRPKRPHIRETLERNRDEIQDAWLDGTLKAMDGAFYKTEKR